MRPRPCELLWRARCELSASQPRRPSALHCGSSGQTRRLGAKAHASLWKSSYRRVHTLVLRSSKPYPHAERTRIQTEALDVYLPLLVDPSQQVVISICGLLSSLLRVHLHRLGVSEWLPPADRAKELHKSKRGWEKPDLRPNAPRRQGGWVARNLVALLKSNDAKVRRVEAMSSYRC